MRDKKPTGRSRRTRIKPRFFVVVGVLVAALLFGALGGASLLTGHHGEAKPGSSAERPHASAAPPPVEMSIVCVGDIMVHRPQIASQYDAESRTYNYDNNFRYVKPYLAEADLALGNVETTFAGGAPTGYPMFNAPDALAKAVKNAGFDVALTSNNHLLDKGLAGLKRTLEVLRAEGLTTAGTRLPNEPRYALTTVKGIKIGVVAYTYRTPPYNGQPTLNSAVLSKETGALVNSFGFESFEADMTAMVETIKAAKKAGATLVIGYFHWGDEYRRTPNDWQKKIADRAVAAGVDILFASHPHVLQPLELRAGSEGSSVPVFYSMGNFLSNQRAETLDNRYTEQGMIARVRLTCDPATGRIVALKADAMGTWMDKYRKNGKDVFAIIPLDRNLRKNPALAESGHLRRATEAMEDIKQLLGGDALWQ